MDYFKLISDCYPELKYNKINKHWYGSTSVNSYIRYYEYWTANGFLKINLYEILGSITKHKLVSALLYNNIGCKYYIHISNSNKWIWISLPNKKAIAFATLKNTSYV